MLSEGLYIDVFNGAECVLITPSRSHHGYLAHIAQVISALPKRTTRIFINRCDVVAPTTGRALLDASKLIVTKLQDTHRGAKLRGLRLREPMHPSVFESILAAAPAVKRPLLAIASPFAAIAGTDLYVWAPYLPHTSQITHLTLICEPGIHLDLQHLLFPLSEEAKAAIVEVSLTANAISNLQCLSMLTNLETVELKGRLLPPPQGAANEPGQDAPAPAPAPAAPAPAAAWAAPAPAPGGPAQQHHPAPADPIRDLTFLHGCTKLRNILLPDVDCSAAGWAWLASLPALDGQLALRSVVFIEAHEVEPLQYSSTPPAVPASLSSTAAWSQVQQAVSAHPAMGSRPLPDACSTRSIPLPAVAAVKEVKLGVSSFSLGVPRELKPSARSQCTGQGAACHGEADRWRVRACAISPSACHLHDAYSRVRAVGACKSYCVAVHHDAGGGPAGSCCCPAPKSQGAGGGGVGAGDGHGPLRGAPV